MKKAMITLALLVALLTSAFYKGQQSKTRLDEIKRVHPMTLNDDTTIGQFNQNPLAQNASDPEAWLKFRSDSYTRIRDHEIRIAALKTEIKNQGMTVDDLYIKRIETLERRNSDLKTRIVFFTAAQRNKESFKLRFNHDLDAVGRAFNDLAIAGK